MSWISRKSNGRVLSGPFAGMRYITESVGSTFYPKILGTYEKELNPIIEDITRKNFGAIVNVGAGEGYYAVGLAVRNPTARIIAYEGDPHGQELICELAQLNGVVERVRARGYCRMQELTAALGSAQNVFVMMDVEGAENQLLDLDQLPDLAFAPILVEVHNFIVPNTDVVLRERFQATHFIEQIPAQRRTIADLPIQVPFYLKPVLRPIYFEMAMGERPDGMSWLYLEPRRKKG
ncbi:MAG TPA: hypothetical protein VFD70_05860 [Anaerolineae bacterium]|nr:hypothetical protein [Anaerolineae bacterium]